MNRIIKRKKISGKIYCVVRVIDITDKDIFKICKIIKDENHLSILSKLSKKLLTKLLIILLSEKNFFYVMLEKEKIIGYIIFSKKYEHLIKFFLEQKYKIILDLVKNIRIIEIMKLIINFFIFKDKKKYKALRVNSHLSFLAITKKYQSKGLGKFFLNISTSDFIEKNNYKKIYVIASDQRTVNFYEKKVGFKYFYKFFECGKIQKVLFKNFNLRS